MSTIPERMRWWNDARFGLFIHWGVYAVPARGEWVMYHEDIPVDEYRKFADEFTARHYKPRDWVALARDAGMKYMVLTTRHHDGFCLFDSKVSDFTAPKTAAGRDLVAEFADACHSMGMRMGLYYSLEDWRFPGQLPHLPMMEDQSHYRPMVEQGIAQIRELLTNYGKVDILWYDGNFPYDAWPYEDMEIMARGLQPEIIINNRAGQRDVVGDHETPEQHIQAYERPWEANLTLNDSWGYTPSTVDYKTTYQALSLLLQCASQGGNLLLNVGPDPEGRIPPPSVERLREIGNWMKVNGRAIYGSERTPLTVNSLGYSTRVGDKMYLIVVRWPGSTLTMAWVGNAVKSATVLADGTKARVEQRGQKVWLHDLPQYAPDNLATVIEIEVEGEPRWPDVRYT